MTGGFKKKLLLLIFFVIVFAGVLIAKFIILDKQNVYGRLKIVSSPATGVFIDNAPVGKTPYDDKYKVGEYLLKLIPEENASGSASWQGKITVYKNALTYVNRELGSSDITSAGEIFTVVKMDHPPKNSNYGEIAVQSDPTGVIVYLDNDEKGVAPLVLADVPKGDHELSVAMPGFLRRTQKVNVTEGYRVNAEFKLALDETQQKPVEPVTPTASPSGALKKATIIIGSTPTGFLRVRSEPSVNGAEIAQVKPGEKYDYLDEQDGWYKIQINSQVGWVSSQYSTKQEQ